MDSDLGFLDDLLAKHYEVALFAQVTHWNMYGKGFGELHRLTGNLYQAFITRVDDLVEELVSHYESDDDFHEVSLPLHSTIRGNGTPLECVELLHEVASEYSDYLYGLIEMDKLHPVEEDTIINLVHFVDLWVWKLRRNLPNDL